MVAYREHLRALDPLDGVTNGNYHITPAQDAPAAAGQRETVAEYVLPSTIQNAAVSLKQARSGDIVFRRHSRRRSPIRFGSKRAVFHFKDFYIPFQFLNLISRYQFGKRVRLVRFFPVITVETVVILPAVGEFDVDGQ